MSTLQTAAGEILLKCKSDRITFLPKPNIHTNTKLYNDFISPKVGAKLLTKTFQALSIKVANTPPLFSLTLACYCPLSLCNHSSSTSVTFPKLKAFASYAADIPEVSTGLPTSPPLDLYSCTTFSGTLSGIPGLELYYMVTPSTDSLTSLPCCAFPVARAIEFIYLSALLSLTPRTRM